MFADDLKVGGNNAVLGDDEASSPATFSSQTVDAFDDHDGWLDQFGQLGKVIRVTLGQIKFG